MRHKHADLIHAWAEGAEIERRKNGFWLRAGSDPAWNPDTEYRVKPEKKPDVVRYTNVYKSGQIGNDYENLDEAKGRAIGSHVAGFIRYVISGETGELIKAEVLK